MIFWPDSAIYFPTNKLIPTTTLIENANSKETISLQEVADLSVNRLFENWNSGGCVDEYTMDQLIIFMALAKGKSSVLCAGETSMASLHLETAIHFTQIFQLCNNMMI